MPSEHSITETGVERGRWEEREEQRENPRTHTTVSAPYQIASRSCRGSARWCNPPSGWRCPWWNHTPTGVCTLWRAEQHEWCGREACYANPEVLQPLSWPLRPAPWHTGDLTHPWATLKAWPGTRLSQELLIWPLRNVPLGLLQHTMGRISGLTCNRVCYENKGK